MLIRLYTSSLIVLLFSFHGMASNKTVLLKEQIANTSGELEKANLYYDLSKLYIGHAIDSAHYFCQLAIEKATFLEDRPLRAKAYYLRGYLYELEGDIEHTLDYYTSSRLDYQLLEDVSIENRLLENLINIAHEHRAYKFGKHYCQERLKLLDQLEDYRLRADVYYDFGLIYKQNEEYVEASLSFQKAKLEYDKYIQATDSVKYADILMELGTMQRAMGFVLLSIGEDYEPYYTKALDFYDQVMKVNPSKLNEAKVANNRGNLWLNKSNLILAKSHFENALEIANELHSHRLLTLIYNNLAITHFELGNLEASYLHFKQSIEFNLSKKGLLENQKDRGMNISFYLEDELSKSLDYIDRLRVLKPNLVADFTSVTQAYYRKEIEKQKAFKKAQIAIIYEHGYGALQKEWKLWEFNEATKAWWYQVALIFIAVLFSSFLVWKAVQKMKIRRYNKSVFQEYKEKHKLK